MPADDVAANLHAQRWWGRQKPLLDKESSSGLLNAVSRLIDQASASGDLAAAVDEIPPYLASRDQPSSYFDNLLAAKMPELAAAREDVAKATRARDIVNHNRDTLHRSYDRGTIPPPPVRADIHDPDAA